MDKHELEQVGSQVGKLLHHGTRSCIQQAESIMVENFERVLNFALEATKLSSKPKRTIADNFPAGGLTATEPCMFCKDYEQLKEENKRLKEDVAAFNKGWEAAQKGEPIDDREDFELQGWQIYMWDKYEAENRRLKNALEKSINKYGKQLHSKS